MWIAIPKVFTSNPESESWILTINDLNYRTQNDFGLAIVSKDNLGESSEKKNQGGGVEFFYRTLQTYFSINFASNVDCHGEVCPSNPESEPWIFKINDLNYRTQNDFRFAIVSADDLEFSPILRTWQRWNIQLLQGSSSMLLVSFWRRCGLRWRSFEF